MQTLYSSHPKLLDALIIKMLLGEICYKPTIIERYNGQRGIFVSGEVFCDKPSIISLFLSKSNETITINLNEVAPYYEAQCSWRSSFERYYSSVVVEQHFELLGERCYCIYNHDICGRLHSIFIPHSERPEGRLLTYGGVILETAITNIAMGIPGCEEKEGEEPGRIYIEYRPK